MLARYRVKDQSMLPSFREGDFVIVRNVRDLKKGDVVVFRFWGKELLKRVERVEEGRVFVLGDNADASTDSRKFGWVPTQAVVGKVSLHAKSRHDV